MGCLKNYNAQGCLRSCNPKTRCKAAWTIETKFPKRSTLKIFCQLHRAFCKGSQLDLICICASLEVLILHEQPLTVNQTGLCGKTLCLLLNQWFKAGLAFWRQRLLSWVFSLNSLFRFLKITDPLDFLKICKTINHCKTYWASQNWQIIQISQSIQLWTLWFSPGSKKKHSRLIVCFMYIF